MRWNPVIRVALIILCIVAFHPAQPATGREICGDLLVNGGFEADSIAPRSWNHLDRVSGWILARGTQFEIQRNLFGSAADGDQYLEIASSERTTIRQTVSTVPGETYLLRLAYSPRPGHADNAIEIRWDGKPVETVLRSGQGASTVDWQELAFALTASGSNAVLELADASAPDGAGGLVDDVRVCRLHCSDQLTNGSFEAPVIQRGHSHLPQIPGWQLARGQSFEIQRNIMGPAASGQQYLELAPEQAISIRQSVATDPADRYLLRFAYSPRPGNRNNAVDILWDGRTVDRLNRNGRGVQSTAWSRHQYLLTAAGSRTILELADASPSDGAAGFIDDVQLCHIPQEREELSVAASHKLEYACDRMGGHRVRLLLEIEGGEGPYTCSGPAGGFPRKATNGRCSGFTSTGRQVFTVTDATGTSQQVVIDVPWVVEIDVVGVQAPCCGCQDGEAVVRVDGKNPPFTLRWNDPKQQTTQRADGLAAGTYTVTATDAEGCRASREVVVPDGC